jgi:hypothetical protein
MEDLVEKINKITGVKYVLPFKNILAIDFETVWLPENFIKERMVKTIKNTIRSHGFNPMTIKNTNSKKFIALVRYNLD